MGEVKGYISEIFKSIQGEGYFAGEVHLFIRLSGCPLRCIYCDTPQALDFVEEFSVEGERKKGVFKNPLTSMELIEIIRDFFPDRNYEKIFITGGEPLYQIDFLRELLQKLNSPYTVLETAGIDSESLSKVLPFVKCVSLDVKMPESSGIKNGIEMFEKSLRCCMNAFTYIKAVIGDKEDPLVLENTGKIARKICGEFTPFFIQPLGRVEPEKLYIYYNSLRKYLKRVKILPQIHKVLGVK